MGRTADSYYTHSCVHALKCSTGVVVRVLRAIIVGVAEVRTKIIDRHICKGFPVEIDHFNILRFFPVSVLNPFLVLWQLLHTSDLSVSSSERDRGEKKRWRMNLHNPDEVVCYYLSPSLKHTHTHTRTIQPKWAEWRGGPWNFPLFSVRFWDHE